MDWEQKLPFLREKDHIISLTGGGGKTTLMYALAAFCAKKGWNVLVLTTTHIGMPEGKPVIVLKEGVSWEEAEKRRDWLWQQNQFVVAGVPAKDDKLAALPPRMQEVWIRDADIVLIEADGSKRHPCKFPAEHEPVILPQSDIVLEVGGLSALNRPLEEVCFRWERAWEAWQKEAGKKKTGVSQKEMYQNGKEGLMPEFFAWLLGSACGGRKGVKERRFMVICNQADTPELQKAGQTVLDILKKQYEISGILTSFQEKERNRERNDK